MKFFMKKGNACAVTPASHYVQAIFNITKKEKLPKKEVFLKKSLLQAQNRLERAYERLSLVNEPDLIDSYIYELNAANLQYQVILRDYKALTEPSNQATCIPSPLSLPCNRAQTFKHPEQI